MERKKFIYRLLLFLLPLVGFVVMLFVRPFNKQFAYHFLRNECEGQSSWIHNRVFIQPQEVDIAFVGSSVTMNGVIEQDIENLLNTRGETVNVTNIGYCRHGRNTDYTILKDLFKTKHPKAIVIEVLDQENRFGHIDFGYIADAEDVLQPNWVINYDPHKDFFHGVVVRFEDFKAGLLYAPLPPEQPGNQYSYKNSTEAANIDALEKQRKDYEDKYKDKLNTGESIYDKFSLSYLDKMVHLAKVNSCKVYFLYFPSYASSVQPKNMCYYKQHGELLIPPKEIFNAPANFKDLHHLNDKGAKLLSAWLAGAFAK